MKTTKSEYIAVRRSCIHNKGVFARKDIPKGTRIIEYIGEKVTNAEGERRADIVLDKSKRSKTTGAVYLFELNKRYDIDGYVPYNTARYINHSCDPNCETEIIQGKIWIIAIKDIQKGEELNYNYGYAFDEDFEEHPCLCGTDRCVGYILDEDDWSKLRRRLKKRASA